MPVTNTKVGFCNEALLLIGSQPIASLTEGTDKATICSLLYERCAGALLTKRVWNFTREKVQLARLVDAPVNKWKYAYQLPSGRILAPWKVYDSLSTGVNPRTEFEIFGDKLYCDYAVVVVDYQVEPAVDKFPLPFTDLLINALAARFAPIISEQARLAEHYHEIAYGLPREDGEGGLYRIAKQADAKTKPPDVLPTSEIVAARMS